MTRYQVIWSESAERELAKLDRVVARRIFTKVGSLSVVPHRHLRRLVGFDAYRLRVGDFRVIVDIEELRLRVLVLKVGHRSSVYAR
ncbi:MAG: type II toxin-antitoxin system RelE/ParE family toxin [Euryarchaeota archaeon]|nr:type II toxin-antitoxin system RelE/ParE family toxin [Euryarchaeota archaeon]MDE1837315.1 type II toxin-antitoxin system RelE/ParE family toxin [Euryarchaeota archaeon]MDE1879813.1 type II toxin-antitoxin system RelE/ParE family toxin [Euryarchaeota archaeon]MDE2045254.1 type II toxin-antitoxin system RelE/ParE family toxin [Thermoplasmata archaeon]